MAEKLSAVKGMNDIAAPESAHWEWLEDKIRGRYNMVNAPGTTTTGEMMRRSLAASGAKVDLAWIGYPFLHAHGLAGGDKPGFPMVTDTVEYGGFNHFSQMSSTYSRRRF